MVTNPAFLRALVAEPGSARPDRDDPRRDPASAPLDDRDADALLTTLRALAQRLRYWSGNPPEPTGTWQPFVPAGTAADLESDAGNAEPHHALLLAFLRLLARPQALLNDFTAEHLQFQMQRVLGFVPLPAHPDRAHLVLEAKKNTAPFVVTPEMRFSAGKDATHAELLFAPARTTVVGSARVEQVASLWHDGARLRFAPVANSADGLGAPLPVQDPRWPPFGHADMAPAPQGFAVASPLLRLAEGIRSVQLKLRVGGWPVGLTAAQFASGFDAWFTGPQGWVGPLSISSAMAGDLLTITVPIGPALDAVVDHEASVHLQAFPAALPVLQLMLKAEADDRPLAGITLTSAQVAVKVQGMRALELESDESVLDPKRAFLPFGQQPAAGSRLLVGCAEALVKPLTDLKLKITWQGLPPDLYAWYAGYTRQDQLSSGVGATVSWQDAEGTPHRSGTVTLLARQPGPTSTLVIDAAGARSAWDHFAFSRTGPGRVDCTGCPEWRVDHP